MTIRTKSLSTRSGLLGLFAVCLVITLCCVRRGDSGFRLNSKFRAQIRSLAPINSGQAFVILEKKEEQDVAHTLKRDVRLTTDAGQTWQTIKVQSFDEGFECVTMIDAVRGWAVDHLGQVFSTDSGGTNWQKISQIADFTGANQIEFLNEKDGWLREFLGVWRTHDGGITWQPAVSTLTPGVHGQPTGMFLIDTNTVVISGSGGQVYVTKDAGNTWRIDNPLSGDFDFTDVWFENQSHGWLTGSKSLRPLLLETKDGGDSWKEIPVDADVLPSSVWLSGDEGWLAGDRRIDDGKSVRLVGTLLHTNDGGKHWSLVQLGPAEPFLTSVRFSDTRHGWLVGRDTLYRTEDAGVTWRRSIELPPPT